MTIVRKRVQGETPRGNSHRLVNEAGVLTTRQQTTVFRQSASRSKTFDMPFAVSIVGPRVSSHESQELTKYGWY